MTKLLIQGGLPLYGKVRVKGSKNASLPVMAASLLSRELITVKRVPDLQDVRTMAAILKSLGVAVKYDPVQEQVHLNSIRAQEMEPPADLVRKMRASFLTLGPLLARHKQVRIAIPGGCNIGIRPVEQHLKGLIAMGAKFTLNNGIIEGEAPTLNGTHIYLDFPSVGATENIMMAAVLARGMTVLENAAREPEVVDLANFLNSIGGRVTGAGTDTIQVAGVEVGRLKPTKYTVIPDRIEVGTLLLAGVITGGELEVEDVQPEHLKSFLAKLKEAGAIVETVAPSILRVGSPPNRTASVDMKTLPYPGFPTDLQPQFMTLLAISSGTSLVTETVFVNRFGHVAELNRMGAYIKLDEAHALIEGRDRLTAAPVRATDLRSAAALLLAALTAQGVTEISDVYHLWRGYSGLEERLVKLGARIQNLG